MHGVQVPCERKLFVQLAKREMACVAGGMLGEQVAKMRGEWEKGDLKSCHFFLSVRHWIIPNYLFNYGGNCVCIKC